MSRFSSTLKTLFWLISLTAAGAGMVLSAFYLYLQPGLPDVDQLRDVRLQTPLRVYSSDNKLIAEFGEKRRTPIAIETVPDQLIQAFLAAEDSRFYEHHGVDIKGLTRATLELLTTGSIQSGGSTITMQVAKNFFLSRERTFIRKFNEILLALQIEQELPKDKILELYLNKIYLGNRAYGVEAAAQVYYGKSVDELTLAQMAMIAGLPKAPSAYNPLADPERAIQRRDWILSRMLELGMIGESAYQQARNMPVTASYHGAESPLRAPYVAELARADLVSRVGEAAYTDGYSVYTTIDSELQTAANLALRQGLEAYDRRHGYRGPIDQWDLAETPDVEALTERLQDIPVVTDMVPAVVIQVEPDHALALLPSGAEAKIAMEDMKWAAPYISENRQGPTPTAPADVVSRGDVIRVRIESQSLTVPVAQEGQEETGGENNDGGSTTDSAGNTAATPDQNLPEPALADPDQPLTAALVQVPKVEGALVSLDTQTGAIQALVGGFSFYQSSYNRATLAKRQPGSTFKPFVYLAALENGATAATIINDAPIVYDDSELETMWRPENASGRFYGPTRLRKALYMSRNMVSIRLLKQTGIDTVLDYIGKLGLNTANLPRNLSLALGSGALSPLEMAAGFALIANGGYRVEPYLIERIEQGAGNLVYQAPEVRLCDDDCGDESVTTQPMGSEIEAISRAGAGGERDLTPLPLRLDLEDITGVAQQPRIAPRVADERAIYILQTILRDVIERGTGRRAQVLGRTDIMGKTGTTNDQRDAWFSGFNHDLETTVWVGFDQPSSLGRSEFGATAALPIWLDYMRVALEGKPSSTMPQPPGIVTVKIDPETGKRAAPGADDAIFEIFREENVPQEVASSSDRRDEENEPGPDNIWTQELF